jgi:hypothetical protein
MHACFSPFTNVPCCVHEGMRCEDPDVLIEIKQTGRFVLCERKREGECEDKPSLWAGCFHQGLILHV